MTPSSPAANLQQIRTHDLTGWVVFVTTHADLSYLVFRHRLEAMDYIIKGNRGDVAEQVAEIIRACMDIAYTRYQKNTLETEYFQTKSSIGIQKIPIPDILYFESHHVPHKIILHTRNKRIEFRGTLKEVVTANPAFFICHKSYVVNIKNVVRVTRHCYVGEAELINGSVIPVSKDKIAQFAKRIGA